MIHSFFIVRLLSIIEFKDMNWRVSVHYRYRSGGFIIAEEMWSAEQRGADDQLEKVSQGSMI